jgi:hypothetical protein
VTNDLGADTICDPAGEGHVGTGDRWLLLMTGGFFGHVMLHLKGLVSVAIVMHGDCLPKHAGETIRPSPGS